MQAILLFLILVAILGGGFWVGIVIAIPAGALVLVWLLFAPQRGHQRRLEAERDAARRAFNVKHRVEPPLSAE